MERLAEDFTEETLCMLTRGERLRHLFRQWLLLHTTDHHDGGLHQDLQSCQRPAEAQGEGGCELAAMRKSLDTTSTIPLKSMQSKSAPSQSRTSPRHHRQTRGLMIKPKPISKTSRWQRPKIYKQKQSHSRICKAQGAELWF
ncbi:hypothetical protein CEXT_530021 [Caerostris extrusa]|uniref:Uncharacterized protein n=1 Tax=Caerostris extrusa TaxID=172846 RepID=A0AAV4QBI4_CAEEX|nr:hypothetical protein CEXT_530021 [Caerostris extrusa]